LTPDLRIKKSLLKCNWTIRKRLPRCKMRLKKRLLAFSRRLHARIRKTRYMHKMRCLLINRRSLLLALRLRSEERFSRNAETDLVCRLLLEKKKLDDAQSAWVESRIYKLHLYGSKNSPAFANAVGRGEVQRSQGCKGREVHA